MTDANTYSARYRYFVLSVLLIASVFSFIDRQLMTILLEPIKAEFGASDTAMGFLSGFAFALFYAVLGLPVARLADRWSRRNVLAISMVVWSGMTALCGLAGTFWQLAILRVGVGVGEAGGTPPSHSLIASYFPPEERSTAMGIYGSGTQIGVLVGMLGGAVIAEQMGWRWAFVIFGLCYFILTCTGVWRSSVKYDQSGGSKFWSGAAQLALIIGILRTIFVLYSIF